MVSYLFVCMIAWMVCDIPGLLSRLIACFIVYVFSRALVYIIDVHL